MVPHGRRARCLRRTGCETHVLDSENMNVGVFLFVLKSSPPQEFPNTEFGCLRSSHDGVRVSECLCMLSGSRFGSLNRYYSARWPHPSSSCIFSNTFEQCCWNRRISHIRKMVVVGVQLKKNPLHALHHLSTFDTCRYESHTCGKKNTRNIYTSLHSFSNVCKINTWKIPSVRSASVPFLAR